jgi:hypothetical protein
MDCRWGDEYKFTATQVGQRSNVTGGRSDCFSVATAAQRLRVMWQSLLHVNRLILAGKPYWCPSLGLGTARR